jgi:hypothetical protein
MIDPSIALGVRQPQVDIPIMNPVQRYATVMSLRDMMTRQQMGQYQLQEAGLQLQRAQQEQQERQAIADLYKQWTTPDPNAPVAAQGAQAAQPWELTPQKIAQLRSAAPNLSGALIKQGLDMTEQYYKGLHEKATSDIDRLNQAAAISQGIVDEPTKLAGIATLFNKGYIDERQRDYLNGQPFESTPFQNTLKSFQQSAPSGIEYLKQQIQAAELKLKQNKDTREAELQPFEVTKAKGLAGEATTKNLVAQLGEAAQTVPDAKTGNQAQWDVWRSGLTRDIQNLVPAMFSPDAVSKVKYYGVPEEKRAEMAQTAAHQAATEAIERGQLGVAQRRENREQNIYNQTYGPGANPALVGVDPKLRTAAAAAAQKAADEIVKAGRTADEMENFINLARAGNKAAYANMPVAGVLEITTSNGMTRINRNELEAYGGAGSLLDKLKGKIGGAVSGAKIPKDVLDDIEQLHNSIRQGAENAYNQKLDAINQNYHANFKPVTAAKPAGGVINVISPEGVPGTIPADKWQEAQKRGFKKQ